MQITETAAEGLKRSYQVKIDAGDIAQRMQRRLGEIARNASIPGFRPGKVPVSLVQQRYGKAVLGEVVQETVNETSAETLKEHNLRPALQPTIELAKFEEGQDLVYDMKVEVLPEIEAPDLSAITLERLKPEISESEVDQAVERLAERNRKAEPVTDGSTAELGDIVVLKYEGTIDGEAFSGGSSDNRSIELGSGMLVPGFEDQLVGVKAGDHVTVKVTFPADYGAEHLAGKDAVFETDVKELKRKGPVVIDDAMAEDFGLDDLAALKAGVRTQMEREYEGVGRQKMKRDLLDRLAESHSFAVPQGMVDLEFNSIWQQFEQERERAKAAGTYKPEEAEDDEKSKSEYRGIAERRVRLGLLLAEVGKNANIQVSQEEVNRAVAVQARQFPGQEKLLVEYYRNNPDALQSLRAPIYEDKVVDHIFGLAQVSDKSLPPDEFMAAARMDDDDQPAVP